MTGRLLVLALAFGVGALVPSAQAFPSGISSDQYGSSGCNSCHGGGQTPDVQIVGPAIVAPGTTREFTLLIEEIASQHSGGFNVYSESGTLAVGGSSSTGTRAVIGTGARTEVTHSAPKPGSGGVIAFSFLWTAPGSYTRAAITGWGNAVNSDGSAGGDRAAQASIDIAGRSLCATRPVSGCKLTGTHHSTLIIKDNADDAKDSLTWKWTRGEATDISEFGDPVAGSTEYTLCVYDEVAGVSGVVLSATVPAGGDCGARDCWQETAKGFSYSDSQRSHDGLQKIVLDSGADGAAKVIVKGKGDALPLPALPLVQDLRVIVQLTNSEGSCWEADYSAPAVKNQGDQFKDQSD